MKSKVKIRYGKKDQLTQNEFDPRNGKFRVTMFIDLDILDEIRKRAKTKGLPYQTYINSLLRETVLGSAEDERIRKIVREELAKRAG